MKLSIYLCSLLFGACYVLVNSSQIVPGLRLTSNEESYVTGVQGFGVDIQCIVNSCLKNASRLKWYKDDVLIAEGTRIEASSQKMHVNHFVTFHTSKDCNSGLYCTESDPCDDGQHCLGNSCCYCESEEFTIVIKNLTLQDSGTYRCDIDRGEAYLEFAFEVYESGITPGFNKNLTFDHSECCKEQDMSKNCQPLCKPFELETHKFDPMDCDSEISKFLHCVTDGGNVSHVHCCRLQLVPPFCWDFCSGDLQRLKQAHHLCLYWLPEILECYEHAYLPLPGPPEAVVINPLDSESLKVCWDPPNVPKGRIRLYTVQYKEVPRFPFFGGQSGGPFVASRQLQSSIPDPIRSAVEMEDPYEEPRAKRVSRFDALQEEDLSPESGLIFDDGNVRNGVAYRRKRNTWVLFTHNGITNETRVKEFKFQKENTTGTCHTVRGLQPATQYIVYVTATNEYGTSLPSVRSIVATPAVLFKNGTLPQIAQCCAKNGVDAECIPKVCDLERTPSAFGALDIALNCRAEFAAVSPCLADGRDHRDCCRSRGVSGECLNLCDGTAKYLGLRSVLCLTLDMHAVYSCIRQGYISLPSPPRNLSVTEITASTAKISWEPPAANAEIVQNYSLFLQNDDNFNEGVLEIRNVASPYTLIGLKPGTSYLIYLLAHGSDGSSLKSVIEEFQTLDYDQSQNVCPFGDVLLGPKGEDYYCSQDVSCPEQYDCVASPSGTEAFCCPTASPPTPLPESSLPNVTECCVARGMVGECRDLCSYNTTLQQLFTYGARCIQHIKTWVDCGSDGRDHRPCCFGQGVPEICLVFCHPPLRALSRDHIQCMAHAETILRCGAEGVLKLPGPPKNLRVTELSSNKVKLAWDPPHQKPAVKIYRVLIYRGDFMFTEINVTGLSIDVPGLKAGEEYTGHVTAENDHGSSISSNNVTFSPFSKSDSGDNPQPPHTLKVVRNNLDSANITWEWDGKAVANFGFNIFFSEKTSEHPRTWSKLNTTNKWIEIKPLERNKHYEIYVTAVNRKDNKESRKSELITVATVRSVYPPSVPMITLSPKKVAYKDGEKIEITCTSSGELHHPNVTLTVPSLKLPVTGVGEVSTTVTASPELSSDKIYCAAVDGYGKRSRSHVSVLVQFGPLVTASSTAAPFSNTVRVLVGLSSELDCAVKANPQPSFTWQYSALSSGKELKAVENSQRTTMRLVNDRQNSYHSYLLIKEISRTNSGFYICKACISTKCISVQFHLIVENLPLPNGPTKIEECCKQQNVLNECQSVCTINIDIAAYENNRNCVKEFPKLLHCAKNGIDHTQCCSKNGVPRECMGLCDLKMSGSSGTVDFQKCSIHSTTALNCVQEGQDQIPSVVRNVSIQVQNSMLHVQWVVPETNGESVQAYVLYYRAVGESTYKTVSTDGTETKKILTGLKENTTYEVTVLAANNRGFSPFSVTQKIALRERQYLSSSRSTAGAVLGVISCMLMAAVIILSIVWFTRSRPYRIPAFFSKLRSRHGPGQCVAFENPGYDREGQIRGLPSGRFVGEGAEEVAVMNGSAHTDSEGRSKWEKADLEAPNDSGSSTPLQKGLRYTQISNTR